MPGVKGRSGRKQDNPLNDNTPHLRRKWIREFDNALEKLKVENPEHYARITSSDGTNAFGDAADAYAEQRENRIARWHRGRDAKNILCALRAIGPGRLLPAAGSFANAKALTMRIREWHRQGRTKSNIAMMASNEAKSPISTKAITKLLNDFAEGQEGHRQ